MTVPHRTMAHTEKTVWVVTHKGLFLHVFDSEDSARKWCLRTKLDKGVRVLAGGIPRFEITGVLVKTMKEAK